MRAGGVFGDALPILLRGWKGQLVLPGESRTVPYLPAMLRARLQGRPLEWGEARIQRSASTETIRVPLGSFEITTWTVAVTEGPTLTYQIEVRPPYRLIRWASDGGEEAVLLGSTRMPYWRLNGPGGEAHLTELGLGSL